MLNSTCHASRAARDLGQPTPGSCKVHFLSIVSSEVGPRQLSPLRAMRIAVASIRRGATKPPISHAARAPLWVLFLEVFGPDSGGPFVPAFPIMPPEISYFGTPSVSVLLGRQQGTQSAGQYQLTSALREYQWVLHWPSSKAGATIPRASCQHQPKVFPIVTAPTIGEEGEP
jgi:hypothetical protein